MTRLQKDRPRRLLGAVAVVALGAVGTGYLATQAGAEPNPSACPGSYRVELTPSLPTWFNTFQPVLRADDPAYRSLTVDIAAPIPAGTYTLDVVSYDGYNERRLTTWQNQEQWFVEFLDAADVVMATSGTTGDVPELADADEATWAGSIGNVTLASPVTRLVFRHAATTEVHLIHSVHPVCVGFTPVQAPTTTTAPTPTTQPPVTTTAQPPATSVPPATTQPPVATTVPATTATVVVLGSGVTPPVAPAAQPIPARPSFTG